jgi:hypothetical protein
VPYSRPPERHANDSEGEQSSNRGENCCDAHGVGITS